MTETARLAWMAGRIAAAFDALPEEQAAAAIAAHINQFWAAPMRRGLLASSSDLHGPVIWPSLGIPGRGW